MALEGLRDNSRIVDLRRKQLTHRVSLFHWHSRIRPAVFLRGAAGAGPACLPGDILRGCRFLSAWAGWRSCDRNTTASTRRWSSQTSRLIREPFPPPENRYEATPGIAVGGRRRRRPRRRPTFAAAFARQPGGPAMEVLSRAAPNLRITCGLRPGRSRAGACVACVHDLPVTEPDGRVLAAVAADRSRLVGLSCYFVERAGHAPSGGGGSAADPATIILLGGPDATFRAGSCWRGTPWTASSPARGRRRSGCCCGGWRASTRRRGRIRPDSWCVTAPVIAPCRPSILSP